MGGGFGAGDHMNWRRTPVRGEVGEGHIQHGTSGNNHCPLNHILKLSNVAWPVIADQCLHSFRWNGVDHTLIPAAEFFDEVADEQRNVFFSFPQRRHSDGEDIQPIIQIRPESLLLYHGLKVAIRRGERKDVGLDVLVGFSAAEYRIECYLGKLIYDRAIKRLTEAEYPETQALIQVYGVGQLTALTYVLTLGSKERFQRSRDVGCYLGGLHLASRGGKQSRNRAIVAVARKLAVLFHRIWITQEPYIPFYAVAA